MSLRVMVPVAELFASLLPTSTTKAKELFASKSRADDDCTVISPVAVSIANTSSALPETMANTSAVESLLVASTVPTTVPSALFSSSENVWSATEGAAVSC